MLQHALVARLPLISKMLQLVRFEPGRLYTSCRAFLVAGVSMVELVLVAELDCLN